MAFDKNKLESYLLLGGINSKVSQYDNQTTEFRSLTNLNFIIPGALSKRPGTDQYLGATISGRITGLYEYEKLNGSSYLIASANTNIYTVTTSSFTAFKSGLANDALFSFVTYVDHLFAANGTDFFKYDGSNTSNYSLPPGTGLGVTAVIGGGLSGIYITSYGYLNSRGYFGPGATGVTINLNGITFGSVQYYGLTNPTGFGITSLVFYRTTPGGVDSFATTFAPFGSSLFTDTGFPLTTITEPETVWFTLAPRFLEIYNNQLFLAGFTAFPSTFVWSQIGEPEGILPEYSAEVRTNDGDRITGLKNYLGSLFVSKERSLHRLSGDDPNNFLLKEITDEYGCLSDRAMVIWESNFWFLDTKGICQWNGSNVEIISTKVEPFFLRMNVVAAKDTAVALHAKIYNEVWFSFPIDGATKNNIVIVFDYVLKAWTSYVGLEFASLALIKQTQNFKTPFIGSYTGSIAYFGSSLTYDSGRSVTCSFETAFLSPMGQSVEKQYRRFYLNVEPILGVTQPISINLRSNFNSSNVVSQTIYQNPFQTRIDFGIAARSIQAQVIHNSASLPVRLYGFTFESRFQRAN